MRIAAMVLMATLTATAARAAADAKVDPVAVVDALRLLAGERVALTTADGVTHEGALRGVTAATVVLELDNGTITTLKPADVVGIRRVKEERVWGPAADAKSDPADGTVAGDAESRVLNSESADERERERERRRRELRDIDRTLVKRRESTKANKERAALAEARDALDFDWKAAVGAAAVGVGIGALTGVAYSIALTPTPTVETINRAAPIVYIGGIAGAVAELIAVGFGIKALVDLSDVRDHGGE